MIRQHKLSFAILFVLNILLAIIGIGIGASFSTIALSISTTIWIVIVYQSLKEYSELIDAYLRLQELHMKGNAHHLKALDIIKESLTREWANVEEFEKWEEEKMKELIKDEDD